MPVDQRDADVSSPCLMHLRLVRWWKGAPSTMMRPPSPLGNVQNAWQRAQTAGKSSSLLLQLLGPKRAVGPKARATSHTRQGHRRDPGPQCSALPQVTVRFGGRFAWIGHHSQMANSKQISLRHGALSWLLPHPRSALCQGVSSSALLCLKNELLCD